MSASAKAHPTLLPAIFRYDIVSVPTIGSWAHLSRFYKLSCVFDYRGILTDTSLLVVKATERTTPTANVFVAYPTVFFPKNSLRKIRETNTSMMSGQGWCGIEAERGRGGAPPPPCGSRSSRCCHESVGLPFCSCLHRKHLLHSLAQVSETVSRIIR